MLRLFAEVVASVFVAAIIIVVLYTALILAIAGVLHLVTQ